MSPATSASASVQTLLLGGGRAGLIDLLGADRRARAVLERELLELAQQPLLAVADLGDERLRAVLVQVELERLAWPSSHFGRSHALTFISAAIWPPAFSTALWSFSGAL